MRGALATRAKFILLEVQTSCFCSFAIMRGVLTDCLREVQPSQHSHLYLHPRSLFTWNIHCKPAAWLLTNLCILKKGLTVMQSRHFVLIRMTPQRSKEFFCDCIKLFLLTFERKICMMRFKGQSISCCKQQIHLSSLFVLWIPCIISFTV